MPAPSRVRHRSHALSIAINALHGGLLGLLCCLWAVARPGFLATGRFAFLAAVAAGLILFALACAAMLRAVVKTAILCLAVRPFTVHGLLEGAAVC